MNLSLPVKYLKIILSHYMGFPLYKPNLVAIVISSNCNLRCQICNFWKKKNDSGEMAKEEYQELFRDLKDYGVEKLQFTGGEPLLRRDFFEIVKSAKESGLGVILLSNGTLLSEENVLKIIELVDEVYISLDAPNAFLQDKIRGVEGAFEKTVKGIKLLSEARRGPDKKPRITVTSIISPLNLHEPQEMLDLARKLGVDKIIYNPASSVDGYTSLNNHFSANPDTMNKYCEMIDKMLSLTNGSNRLLKLNPFYLESSKKFLKGNKRYFRFSCYAGGYNGAHIGIDGEVYPCCAWNASFGNLKNADFATIWESQRANELRAKIRSLNCPMCYHHTRTFDYLIRAPIFIRNPFRLIRGYKRFFSMREGD